MKMLKINSITMLALALTAFVFAEYMRPSAYAQDVHKSKIIGVVLDKNNARIAGATIKIENAQFNRKLQSSDEGKFEIALPAGEYQLTVEQQGFRKFELSPFRANAGVCELVNIHMEVKPPRGLLKVG
jgi:uncharacterized membrane protein